MDADELDSLRLETSPWVERLTELQDRFESVEFAAVTAIERRQWLAQVEAEALRSQREAESRLMAQAEALAEMRAEARMAAGSEETVELCSFPNSGPVEVQPDLTHLAFEVESLEEFGQHLTAHGLKYSDGPTMKETGGGFAFIDAPEGYEIELIQIGRKPGTGGY